MILMKKDISSPCYLHFLSVVPGGTAGPLFWLWPLWLSVLKFAQSVPLALALKFLGAHTNSNKGTWHATGCEEFAHSPWSKQTWLKSLNRIDNLGRLQCGSNSITTTSHVRESQNIIEWAAFEMQQLARKIDDMHLASAAFPTHCFVFLYLPWSKIHTNSVVQFPS